MTTDFELRSYIYSFSIELQVNTIRTNQQLLSHQPMALPLRREFPSPNMVTQLLKTPQYHTSPSHIEEFARHSSALYNFLTHGRLAPIRPIPIEFTIGTFKNKLTIHYSLIETPSLQPETPRKGRTFEDTIPRNKSLNPTAEPFLPPKTPSLNVYSSPHTSHSHIKISTQTPQIPTENCACQTNTLTSESSTQTPSPSTCDSAIQASTSTINTPTQTSTYTTDSQTQTTYSSRTSSCQTDITSSSISALYNEIKDLKTSICEYKDKNMKLHNLATKLV